MDNKTFETFVTMVKEEVERNLPEELNGSIVKIQKTNKNNEVLTGISIIEPEKECVPVIYLNDYLSKSEMETDIKDVAQHVINAHMAHRTPASVADIVSLIANRNVEELRKHVSIQMVGLAGNEKYLDGCVYDKFLDMAAIYTLKFPNAENTGNGYMSLRITEEVLRSLSISKKELRNMAHENMDKANYIFTDMADYFHLMNLPHGYMYILSSVDFCNGANAICFQELLRDVYETLGRPYAILPSSIHELVVLPYDEEMDAEYLREMVNSVNSTVVKAGEILTNSVYLFNGTEVVIM